jgi:hypothetical protein
MRWGPQRQRRNAALDLRVSKIRPVALDADERRSGGSAERAIWVLPAAIHSLANLGLGRVGAIWRIDFAEPDPHAAVSGEQDRQVRGIDLRKIPQHVDQPTQAPRNGQVHPFPHDRLRLRIAVVVRTVVQDLDQPDPLGVEPRCHVERMIVAPLVDLVPLERRPDENRQNQFALSPHEIGQRKHRPGTRSLTAGADDDDDGILVDHPLDLVAALFQSPRRKRRVVPRPKTACRGRADQEPLFLGYLSERELIRIEKPGGDRAPQPFRVLRVGLVRDGDVPREECLQRTQDVSPAATSADKKNVHFAPVCFTSANRIGTTTHLPAARRRSLTTK